ncbi:hypothetical protein G6F49_011982 [Rhizopus delemar]|nr:hypothetical protein G6F49_011982 [Rhizopus delemar]KAG1578494.1 hypothetical protein G6F48_011886 [Rhizopus delemar]KAG1629826.1 hypothetical protein G6F44_011510 [Rhizopus delemar]
MQPISEDLRNRIISCLKNGYSISKTVKTTGASRGTVQNVRKTIKNEVNSIKAGRPKLLSSRDDQYLVRLVTVKGQENAVEARNTLENDLRKIVSAKTARRLLQDWKRVIWSDGTKVNRFESDGKLYAWKQPNEKLKRRHVKQTVKHGGGSLMVWSCISWYGVGYIVDSMTDYCKENGLRMTDFEFMQDNVEWPPQSPDLNAIENMWNTLKKRLFKQYDCPPVSMDELWTRTFETWYEITEKECQIYIKTMSQRCIDIIENKGLWINY